jgi:hypothetical protein
MSTYINFHAVAREALLAYPSSHLYFLLDHSGLPGLHSELLKTSLKWISLFDGTLEKSAPAAAPILVLAGSKERFGMSRRLCDWIARNGTYTSTVLILSSPLQFESLATRLKARLLVTLSDDMDAMLRFFDPRIFETLTKVLSSEQSKSFFSPADRWYYVDRAGELMQVTSNFSREENFSPPLVLNQCQEFALLDESEIDQVLDLLRSNLPTLLAALPLNNQSAYVSRKIELAKRCGFRSVSEFAICVAICLLKGEEFAGSSLWQVFIEKLKKDELDLSEDYFLRN